MKDDATINLGAWLPDLPALNNPGCLIARNVIPQLAGFRSLNSLQSFSSALDDVCLGTIWAQDDTNTVFNFAGDATKLYRLSSSNVWSDVSGPSAPYNVNTWEFIKFGERIIASSFDTDAQYYEMGASSAFADLGGTPPRGRRIAAIRDFIVLGDTDINGGGGGDTVGPNFLQWSGFNNSELWTPSLATQSDFQELRGKGGRVQKIVPGEYGVIFQEHSIRRMDYIGPPVIFQIDEIEAQRGTPAPNSVVWSGGLVYFFGWDDFYVFNGSQTEPIATDKCIKYFTANSDDTVWASMRAVIDRVNRLVIWSYKSSSAAPINDRLLIFNRVSNRWAEAYVDTEVLSEFVSPGYSLDDLDTLFADIDAESIPVDSPAYQGGGLNIQAFDSLHRSATFAGDPMEAIFETRERAGGKGNRAQTFTGVRPLIEAPSGQATTTVQLGTRNQANENVIYTLDQSINTATGFADFRRKARYVRSRLTVNDGFKDAVGVQYRVRDGGARRVS